MKPNERMETFIGLLVYKGDHGFKRGDPVQL